MEGVLEDNSGHAGNVEPVPCSRLCVKNLPKYVDEKRLREHFSAKGEVTDAKVVRTRDGKSRCFGFVGYRSLDDAVAAYKYFSRSFMDTMQLEIEYAQQYGKTTELRPWSKYTPGSSAHAKVNASGANAVPVPLKAREAIKLAKAKSAAAKADKEEEDPKLAEFLELMAPRSKKATWSNDDAIAAVKPQGGTAPAAPGAEPESASDDEEYEDLPGKPLAVCRTYGVGGHSEEESPSDAEDAPASKDGVVTDAAVSHLDYLKSRQTARFSDEEEEEGQGGSDTSSGSEETQESEEEVDAFPAGDTEGDTTTVEADDGDFADNPNVLRASQSAAVKDTGRLFVRNLPYGATDDELRELFAPHGELSEVHIVKDRTTRQSKGFAHVQFATPTAAVTAQDALDGAIFQGRLIHVLPGRPAPKAEDASEGGDRTFKEERARNLKATAGTNRAAWNSLFVRADTVAEAVAAHFGVPKSALLDREAADVAVRLALGEAQVFAATKSALADAGVDIDALEQAAAAAGKNEKGSDVLRSDRAILIKNLPWSTGEVELESLFAESGEVARFVLPPTKALAIVEFDDASDAKRAFHRLAYKPYHHVPLYLEWAPKTIFSGPRKKPAVAASGVKSTAPASVPEPEPEASSRAAAASAVLPADDGSESTSVYVKNLAWSTGDETLFHHFAPAAEAAGTSLRSARIARKAGPDGKPLSAGYGFVECASEAAARELITALQGSVLDGHKLVLQLSQKKGKHDGKDGGSAGIGTKIVVRNIAFEATRKDILSLFTSFGDVKSCRLPRKFDGTHRGFAFVEFSSKQETKNAVEAVQGTHLYGRRLVIEAAAEDGGLDELRAKTAAKFSSILEPSEELGKRAPTPIDADEAGPPAGGAKMSAAKRRKKGA